MSGSDVTIDGKAGDRVITADSAPQSLTNFLQRCDNQALDATQDDWRGYQWRPEKASPDTSIGSA